MSSFYACDNRLRSELPRLEPTPGYCIFVDVVDSVALKYTSVDAWCAAMNNVIAPARGWLSGINRDADEVETGINSSLVEPHGLPTLKVIGDCVMFYVPKRSMDSGVNALTIFDSLLNIIRVPKEVEVHVAVCSCQHAYEVTFVKGTDDIHGRDIDLTSRLLKEAGAQELVMNEEFYFEAKCNFLNWKDAGNIRSADDGYEQFANVQGPWTKSFKGFKEPVNVYKWRGPRLRPRPGPPVALPLRPDTEKPV